MAKSNIVDWTTITNFVVDSFVGYGIPREDAIICADVLLESDKRGIEADLPGSDQGGHPEPCYQL